MAVEEMPFEDIACEKGQQNVVNKLREFFMPQLEVSLPRAFEAAVYGQGRQSKEGFAEYIGRYEKAFARLAKKGVDLPEGAQGYILYRQVSLSENQEQRLLTWNDGKYDKKSIIKSLRKLDKVNKDKENGKSHYVIEYAEGIPEEESEQAESDGEEYIYLADGNLDKIYSENEVVTALASYREAREMLKNQRLGRGFFPPRGYGGKGGQKGKNKVYIEQLKLRTKCWKYNAIGHWGREYTHPENSPGTSSSASSTSAKSGFFVVSENGSQVEGAQYWLRKFVEEPKEEDSSFCSSADPQSERAYKDADAGFCGITTKSYKGVVDTAAEGGLIGN